MPVKHPPEHTTSGTVNLSNGTAVVSYTLQDPFPSVEKLVEFNIKTPVTTSKDFVIPSVATSSADWTITYNPVHNVLQPGTKYDIKIDLGNRANSSVQLTIREELIGLNAKVLADMGPMSITADANGDVAIPTTSVADTKGTFFVLKVGDVYNGHTLTAGDVRSQRRATFTVTTSDGQTRSFIKEINPGTVTNGSSDWTLTVTPTTSTYAVGAGNVYQLDLDFGSAYANQSIAHEYTDVLKGSSTNILAVTTFNGTLDASGKYRVPQTDTSNGTFHKLVVGRKYDGATANISDDYTATSADLSRAREFIMKVTANDGQTKEWTLNVGSSDGSGGSSNITYVNRSNIGIPNTEFVFSSTGLTNQVFTSTIYNFKSPIYLAVGDANDSTYRGTHDSKVLKVTNADGTTVYRTIPISAIQMGQSSNYLVLTASQDSGLESALSSASSNGGLHFEFTADGIKHYVPITWHNYARLDTESMTLNGKGSPPVFRMKVVDATGNTLTNTGGWISLQYTITVTNADGTPGGSNSSRLSFWVKDGYSKFTIPDYPSSGDTSTWHYNCTFTMDINGNDNTPSGQVTQSFSI